MDVGQIVDKEDLRDVRDTILNEMRAGFLGVHQRQDLTNGRVNAGEIQGATHEAKIRNLEATVFARRSSDAPPVEPEQRGITRRDVQMVAAGASGLGVVILTLWKLLPVLLKALQP